MSSGIIFVAIRCAYLYCRRNDSVSKSNGGHPQLFTVIGYIVCKVQRKCGSSRNSAIYPSTVMSEVKFSTVYILIVSKSLYRIRSRNGCFHFGKVCQCIRFSAFQTRSSNLNSGYLTMLSNRTWTTRCQVHVSRT